MELSGRTIHTVSCNPKGLWYAKRGYWNAKLRLFQIKRGAGRRAFLPETTFRNG